MIMCLECGSNSFEDCEIEETLNVKGRMITNTHKYKKCKMCGELYEPFDDPDYNLRSDYKIYDLLNA